MQQVRAETIGNGLYTVYVNERRLSGSYTLQQVSELYDKSNSKTYKLERRVDGRWFTWGTYCELNDLVVAAAELGKLGYNEYTLRVSEVKE